MDATIGSENTKKEVLNILNRLSYKKIGEKFYKGDPVTINGPTNIKDLLSNTGRLIKKQGRVVYENYNPKIIMNVHDSTTDENWAPISEDSKKKLEVLVKNLKRPTIVLHNLWGRAYRIEYSLDDL